jgi:hypothetical protein
VSEPTTPSPGTTTPTSPLAVGALVLAIGSLVTTCFPAGAIAWYLGKRAGDQIGASGGSVQGAGIARAARILGLVSTAIAVVFWVVLVILAVLGD